jgi:hypothetical protein
VLGNWLHVPVCRMGKEDWEGNVMFPWRHVALLQRLTKSLVFKEVIGVCGDGERKGGGGGVRARPCSPQGSEITGLSFTAVLSLGCSSICSNLLRGFMLRRGGCGVRASRPHAVGSTKRHIVKACPPCDCVFFMVQITSSSLF